jgi:hypothetical protein
MRAADIVCRSPYVRGVISSCACDLPGEEIPNHFHASARQNFARKPPKWPELTIDRRAMVAAL